MKNIQTPAKIHLSALINKIKQGSYVIPDFQRPFEWKPTDIDDLITSVLQDYFIGTLLLWRANRSNQSVLSCENIQGFKTNELNGDYVVLDGQQRITAMHYAFIAPPVLYPVKGYVWRYLWFIDLNIVLESLKQENPDLLSDSVIRSYGKVENMENAKYDVEGQIKDKLFPVYLFERNGEYYKWLQEYAKEYGEQESKTVDDFFNELLDQFYISYIELESDIDIPKVCDIFTRLNSKGVRLTIFDLLNAMLRPQGIKLKEMYDEIESSLEFKLNGKVRIFLLQVISMLLQEYASPKFLSYLVPGAVKKEKDIHGQKQEKVLLSDSNHFSEYWNRSVNLTMQAMKYLQNLSTFGVVKEYFLPYQSMIPILAVLLNEKQNSENNIASIDKKIKMWYWSTVITQNYSSSVDSKMTKDLQDMRKWFKDDNAVPSIVVDAQQRIESIDLTKEGPNSAIYKAIINLLFLEGAKDFVTYEHISLTEDGGLNDHHIVARSWGEKNGLWGTTINTILNRTLLYDKTNKHVISDDLPNVYIKDMLEKSTDKELVYKTLESHMISRKAVEILLRENFSKEDYQEFIEERQRTIMDKLRSILEVETKSTGLITPDSEFSNIVMLKNAIKRCTGELVWIDKYVSFKTLETLMEALREMNDGKVLKVMLLSSIDKLDRELRDRFMRFRDELSNRNIISEMRVIVDSQTKASIHDRWLIGDNIVLNIPSADVVARGQYSEIKETQNRPPFETWWNNSLDVVSDWSKIEGMQIHKI